MRKLQELVPNMERVKPLITLSVLIANQYIVQFLLLLFLRMFLSSQQTSTSDMLDLAVGYIKDLQTQVKV